MEEEGNGGGWCCSIGLAGLQMVVFFFFFYLGCWVTVVGLWLVCCGLRQREDEREKWVGVPWLCYG